MYQNGTSIFVLPDEFQMVIHAPAIGQIAGKGANILFGQSLSFHLAIALCIVGLGDQVGGSTVAIVDEGGVVAHHGEVLIGDQLLRGDTVLQVTGDHVTVGENQLQAGSLKVDLSKYNATSSKYESFREKLKKYF